MCEESDTQNLGGLGGHRKSVEVIDGVYISFICLFLGREMASCTEDRITEVFTFPLRNFPKKFVVISPLFHF